MKNKKRKLKFTDYLLAIGIILLSLLCWYFFWQANHQELPKEPASFNDLFLPAEVRIAYEQELIVSGNCLMAVSAPNYEYKIVYASIISKLIECESQGDKWAIGKANEKGILQFKDSTFQHFCIDRYGLPNNIWSADIQKECCDRMIGEGYIKHWSCYSKI